MHIFFPVACHIKTNRIGMLTSLQARDSGCIEILLKVELVEKGYPSHIFLENEYIKALSSLKTAAKVLQNLY